MNLTIDDKPSISPCTNTRNIKGLVIGETAIFFAFSVYISAVNRYNSITTLRIHVVNIYVDSVVSDNTLCIAICMARAFVCDFQHYDKFFAGFGEKVPKMPTT